MINNFVSIPVEEIIRFPFFTNPISGFKFPINSETGDEYPNCCESHRKINMEILKWYTKFPNCCKQHRELSKKKGFKKSNYDMLLKHIPNCIIYTAYHISSKINNDDWFKDISYYIQYTKFSFGTPAIGWHLYQNALKAILNQIDQKIPLEKKRRIIELLGTNKKDSNSDENDTKTDLNILHGVYQKWLKIFPFELSFFKSLKNQFKSQLPFLVGELDYNPYLKMAIAQMHTKDSLIEALMELTNKIITQINTKQLFIQGNLNEPEKLKLEILLNERELKLKQGYVNQSKDEEQRFRKILKEWFNDEKKFIDEITPLLKALPPHQTETKTEKLKQELGKFGFFELSKVKQLSEPNKQSLIELLSTNGLPYGIAMFEFLGFLKHLKAEHFKTDKELFQVVAKCFGSAERAVKGNIYVLNDQSKEDRTRYTADQHKQTVKKDYEKLK